MAPAADGRLPAALLRPEDPARHHPQSRQAWPGALTQHQQMGRMDGRGRPPRQATSPQIPAASHQRQPWGGTSGHPTDSVCQRQEAGGGQTARWAEEAHGSRPALLALLGTDMPYRYFGTPGRVLRPASISALWPPSPCGPHLEGHISLCNLSPPHPGMRGHAAPDPLASSRTWKVSAL